MKSNYSLRYNKSHFLYQAIILCIAIQYSYLLAYIIPMEEITDRGNYLIYAANSELIQNKYLSRGILSFLTNEPIWLLININLSKYLNPEQVVSIIIFSSSFILSYLILNHKPKFFVFLLLILFFPPIIGKNIVHLRQGLAITIFMLGWFSKSKKLRLLLLLITPLIHASFFFILLLLALTSLLKKINLSNNLKFLIIAILGLSIGFGLEYIVSNLGTRQATEYTFSSANISGLGFIFWSSILILYLSQGNDFIKDNTFAIITMVFYLSTYFLLEVTGRIFESTIIIVLISSLNLTNWRKYLCIIMIISFEFLSWILKLDQPWFGWGSTF